MGQQPVVAIVTGASRGAGKGVAVALGSHGCVVYVTGRSEVTEYWARLWKNSDPVVTPLMISATPDGSRVAVEVHQVVRDRSGAVLSDSQVTHVYTFEGRLVTRMDIGPGS